MRAKKSPVSVSNQSTLIHPYTFFQTLTNNWVNMFINYLDKTESAWHETNLFCTKEEGPVVVKQLLKIKNEEKF